MLASDILKIPSNQPERLFDKDMVKSQYRTFLKEWHPDINHDPQARDVTTRLVELFDEAERRIASGTWYTEQDAIVLTDVVGRQHRIKYRFRDRFELGEVLYGNTNVAFIVGNQSEKLFSSYLTTVATMHYASPKMAADFSPFFPKTRAIIASDDERKCVVVDKPAGSYRLRELMRLGPIDPTHVAWIMSCVLNINCYLSWAKLMHGDLSPDSVFVQPSTHQCQVLGGWWYASQWGEPITHLPTRSVNIVPRSVLSEKRADPKVDPILARALGRELLGDISGTGLAGKAPQPMIDFLRSAPRSTAMEDYKFWKDDVLPASFGERRFVRLDVSDSDIFTKGS